MQEEKSKGYAIGEEGNYVRTKNRRDFTFEPPGETILAALKSAGYEVAGVGKIEDIFANVGLTKSSHTTDNDSGVTAITVGAGARVSGGTYGIEIGGSGSTINSSGRISGGSAAIWYNGSNNTLNVYNSALFNGAVDFNSTTGNTINFHTGSYTLAVEDYLVNSNQINVKDKSLTLITSGIDPDTKAGNIVVVDNKAVSASPGMVRDFAGGILGLVGDIIDIDAPRPARTSGAPLGYADTTGRPSPTDIQTGSLASSPPGARKATSASSGKNSGQGARKARQLLSLCHS